MSLAADIGRNDVGQLTDMRNQSSHLRNLVICEINIILRYIANTLQRGKDVSYDGDSNIHNGKKREEDMVDTIPQ